MGRRPVALGVLAAALFGCALTPDYERPEVDAPTAWEQPSDRGASIANLPWWDLYADPDLQQLIAIALDGNRELALTAARVQEFRYRVTFTRADQFPFLDAFASAGRGRESKAIFPTAQTENLFSIEGTLSFEIDLWRKFARATEAARAELLATEAAYRTLTIELVAGVASSYWLLRDLDARLAIARDTVESRRESLEIIRARFERGTVPELDVNQAEIQLAIAEAAAATFARELARTENLIRVLLGENPGPILRGLPLKRQPVLPEIPAGLPSALLDRRPDVAEAEQALAAATARIGVARAQRFPSISLTGSLGAVAEELSDFSSNEVKAWNIAAGIAQPIFNAGQLRAQERIERARAEQALHAYTGTLLQAFREVEDALVAIRTLEAELDAQERRAAAARNATRLSRARYDAGIVDYLEVLDSEERLFDAELAESETRREALSAVVDLYRALGGGWTPPDVEMPTEAPTGSLRADPAGPAAP